VAKASEKTIAQAELERFLEVSSQGRYVTYDDLTFWKQNRLEFPNLYNVWLQNRSIRPSSAHLESRFSIASRIVPSERESMAAETHSAMLRVKTSKISTADIKAFVREHINDPGRPSKVADSSETKVVVIDE